MDDHRNDDNPSASALVLPALCDDAAVSAMRADDAGVVHRLRGLAEDIDSFVALQNSRLERVIDASLAGGERQGEFDRRQSELESREREFERRQHEALEHAKDECEKLTAAWDRLESQQRKLLSRGDEAATPANSFQAPQPISAAPVSVLPGSDIDLIGDVGMPSTNPAVVQPWTREPAAEQFQQMKREIRRHARRRKP